MAGKQHDKRSVRWDLDPKILARLELVADMMVQKRQLTVIAQALNMTLITVKRDAARVRELWRRASLYDIDEKRAKSLAQYEKIQAKAWEQVRKAEQEGRGAAGYMRLIMEVEDRITKLDGTIINRLDVTSKGESIVDAREVSDDELAAVLSAQKK